MRCYFPRKVWCALSALIFIALCPLAGTHGALLLWNVPAKNPHFTDRDPLFPLIAQELQLGVSLYVIAGSAGIGKSQFVKEFAHRFQEAYNIIWWFDANKTLLSQFVSFAQALNSTLPKEEQIVLHGVPPEKITEKVKILLRTKQIKCLFIFDNVEDVETITGLIPFSHGKNISVLVTSRKKSTAYPSIGMQHFSKADAATFIRKILPQEREEEQMKLVRSLYGHPLALAMASATISTYPSVCVASYLQAQKNQETATLEKGLKVDQYENSIQAALQISLDMTAKKLPAAARALKLLTFMHPTQIPFSYLEYWVTLSRSSETADQILKMICDQSLLEVSYKFDPASKEKKKKNVRLKMHDLVHQVIHQQISDSEKIELLPEAIGIVLEAFGGRNDLMNQRILRNPEHLMHAQKVLGEAKRLNYESISLLALQIRVLDCVACGQRDFEVAKALLADIRNTQVRLKENSETLTSDSSLSPLSPALDVRDEALLEIVCGFLEAVAESNYERACAHQERALSLLENLPGEEEQKLRALVNLLQYKILRGEMEQAALLVMRGKKLFEKSQSDLDKSFFIFGCALYLTQNGQFAEAVQCIDDHAGLLLRIKDYPTHEIFILRHKAKALIKMGKTEACNKALDNATKLIQDFFGERETPLKEDVSVLRILNNVAQSTSDDVEKLQKILQSYTKTWHGENKNQTQAFAHFVLGQVYEHLGEKQKALEAYLKSEEIYRTLLKDLKIDDFSQLYTAIVKLGRQLDMVNYYHSYRSRHLKIFGVDHPRSLEILKYLLEYKDPT